MSAAIPAIPSNRLIERLPRADRRRILAQCEAVDLVFGTVLCEPGEALRHVYFPVTGCISLVATVGGHPPLEMDLIGSEGMLGLTLALDVGAEAPLRGVVKGNGSAWRMPAPAFRRELRQCPALLRSLQRQLFVLISQLARTAACTGFHEVEARLARWLLMSHDRAHADHFHLTHETLADMLGVQRSAVTIAAGALQKAQLISYRRGDIQVLDREGLEAAACECYEAAVASSARRIAPGEGPGADVAARSSAAG